MPEQIMALKIQEEIKSKGYLFYKGEELKAYNSYLKKFELAKSQRRMKRREFDDMDYETDYQANLDAYNSYLREKRNDDEVRVVTGIVEKKIEAVVNELLAMNLQPEIQAFNLEDKKEEGLGDVFSDIITRTNQIERDDDMWQSAITELLTQRAVFIEETLEPEYLRDKRKNKIKINESTKRTIVKKKLLCGLNVFLGDITIPAYRFNEQPFIIKYDRVLYAKARLIFQKNKNWQYVKPGMPATIEETQNPFNYRLAELTQDEVEIITYMSYCDDEDDDDEYQVIVNGVMMEEINTKLPWEWEGYNITMTVLKETGNKFAYGKPLTASAKTLHAFQNETIRNLIRKMRQAIEPPLSNNSKRIIGRDVWSPGAITQGIKKDDLQVLVQHQGVTTSELAMYDLIERKVEEFIGVSNLQQGLIPQRGMTATQTLEMQKQAIKMLAHSVLATIRMKRDITYLRLFNILENYTQPAEKKLDPITKAVQDAYRRFTIEDGEFENQQTGQKEITFMNRDLSNEESRQIFDYEEQQAAMGKPVRIITVNVDKLRSIPFRWFVAVNQSEREGTALQKVLFEDQFMQAMNISKVTGRPINADKIIQSFERIWKVKDYFTTPEQPQMGMEQGGGQMQELMGQINALEQTPIGTQIESGMKAPARQPGLNTLLQQSA